MPEVPVKNTYLSPQEAADYLAEAMAHHGVPLKGSVLALLLALSDLETATWQRMYRWNFGNIIALPQYQAAQAWYGADDSGNARRFRAYGGPEEGASQFVRQIIRESRRHWRDGLMSGDPEIFVRALSGADGGPAYFEANPDRYLAGFLSRWERYRHLSRSGDHPTGISRPKGVAAG